MQENSVTAVPVSGATVTTSGISGNGNQTAGGGGGGGAGSGVGHTPSNPTSGATTTLPTPVSSPSNSSTISEVDQAQFEADKRAVYKHPLFSLLALLLEKCEQATQGYIPSSNSSSPNGSTNGTSDGDSFSRDVQAFVQMLEKEKRPLLTNNSELDGLMIKALQVLRIHLLELEKVQELCRDFCTRYIACLRGKMQSENLLRSDYALEHNNNLSNSNSPINSPEQDLSGSAQGYYQNTDYLSGTDTNEYSNMQAGQYSQQQVPAPLPVQPALYAQVSKNLHIPSNTPQIQPMTDLVPVGVPFPQHHPHPLQTQPQILGTTPLSQIGIAPLVDSFVSGQLSPSGSSDELDSELDGLDELGDGGSKRSKRGILPKHATSVMRAWLFQHLVHPYPTEDEKRAIASQTNLTLLQVNNWFINARRRILQPMLEHASDNSAQSPPPQLATQVPPTGDQQHPVAAHPPSPATKRYWPDTPTTAIPGQLANIENISVNINRAAVDSERLLLAASRKMAGTGHEHFLQHQPHPASSEDESSDSNLVAGGGR